MKIECCNKEEPGLRMPKPGDVATITVGVNKYLVLFLLSTPGQVLQQGVILRAEVRTATGTGWPVNTLQFFPSYEAVYSSTAVFHDDAKLVGIC
jgi:hypothetical protein